jgi:hypothetical protein
LTVAETLKLAVILSADRRHDFAVALLRQHPLSQLPRGELRAPQPWLAPLDGAATVWEDAQHF